MAQTVVSTKYQVVIPKEVRQSIDLRAGQKLQILVKNGVITLVPLRPLAEAKGLVKGLDPAGLREKTERL